MTLLRPPAAQPARSHGLAEESGAPRLSDADGPRHSFKVSADWRVAPRWTVGLDVHAVSSQVVHGNEGGNHPELGKLGGYAVAHGRVNWDIGNGWKAYLRVHNLFDRRYATFAAGSEDLFPGGVAVQPGEEAGTARFIAPGAPRLAVAGVRYEWK